MAGRTLVTVELRFTTDENPTQLADRMREAVATIVGKTSLEEFRVKTLPLDGPTERDLRPVE